MRQAHGARPCAAVFFHPDFPESSRFPTVGSGIGPDLLTFRIEASAQGCAGYCEGLASMWKRSRARTNSACESVVAPTAGGESHPALKTLRVVVAGEPAREF